MSTEGVQPTAQNNGNSANPVLSAPTGNGTATNPTPQAATTNEQNGNAGNGNVVEELLDVGKLKSVVWQHYTKVRINEIVKAKCNYCKKQLGGESNNGTTHLKNHTKICVQKKIRDGSQKILGPHYLAKGKQDLVATAFNSDFSKRELAIAITMHEYPLSMVDHLYFKRFVCSLQPLFTVPSRNTIKKEVFKIYDIERAKIQSLFDINRGRIAITTDLWTATNQKKGYMAVTAHYIDNSWVLRSHMLRFAYVPAPHTAERLGTVLVNCLLDWNVDNDAAAGAGVLEGCFSPTSEANLVQLQPDAETTEGNKQKTLFQLSDFFQPLIYVNEIEIVCLNVFCLSFVALAAGWNQGMQNAALLLLLESGVWRPEVKSLSCCCVAAAIEAALE
ncbi:unnamed protein product [Linum tenue]|uniref:BED-type domain-containing protein n=1 Tax=Linum tenue TaxID=586396 RepID=A0AAV0HNK1_9ROSI|nr:unnamed protein product [Linum tenue]